MSSGYSQQTETVAGMFLRPTAGGAEDVKYWYMICRSGLHTLPAWKKVNIKISEKKEAYGPY